MLEIRQCCENCGKSLPNESNEAMICINPGGEETWERLVSAHGQPNCPLVVLNNSYSTTYDLGNKKNFEEVGTSDTRCFTLSLRVCI